MYRAPVPKQGLGSLSGGVVVGDWLSLLGVYNVAETRTGARADCPFHDNSSGKQTFSLHGTRYTCFSASCGVNGTIFHLAKHFGTTVPDWVLSHQSLVAARIKPDELPLYQLANMETAYHFVESRGLPQSVADEWWLRYDGDKNTILIPIFDHEGRYISRAWRRKTGKMRYQNEAGMPREQLLYGLHTLIDGDTKPDRVFLVEGFGDVWKARAAGIPAVGTYGANLCAGQVELLLECGISKVSIMYDNDDAGWKGAVRGFDTACDVLSVDFAMNYAGAWPKDPGEADDVCLRRLAKYRESFVDFWNRTAPTRQSFDLTG